MDADERTNEVMQDGLSQARHRPVSAAGEPPGQGGATDERSRIEVLRTIQARPGIYLRELARVMRLSVTTVRYHVDRLEAEGRITSDRRSRYRHIYPGRVEELQLQVLNTLNEPPRDRLISILVDSPGARPVEIARVLGLTEGTIAHHLRVIESRGLIDVQYGPGGRRITLRDAVVPLVHEGQATFAVSNRDTAQDEVRDL